jgi:trans-aconitate methyltransferase
MSAAEEYVTDVPYVRAFENDLSPARLRIVSAFAGKEPPPGEEFDYCELGCAHGDTTATLAAAYPKARFVGVDLNPTHIASAKELASAGELSNVTFLERDFDGLEADEGLPQFDFITAHGVVSWVSPQKRAALLSFADKKLKPGGLFHVSYNALPGWASVEPLRQLIASRAALEPGDSAARAKSAALFAKALMEGGAEYFNESPAARAMMKKMETLGWAYVAHEYLHAHWVPMYFAQVASEMAAHDLYFVGQLPLWSNYRDLAIPHGLAKLFAGVGDRITFESLKDFATNEYLRRDVFTKGRPVKDDDALARFMKETPFGGPASGSAIPREAVLRHHTLAYRGPVFDPLIAALEDGALSVGDLTQRPELKGFGRERIEEAVVRLALGEAIAPMQSRTTRRDAPADALYRIPSAFNRGVLRRALKTESGVALASTVAGTGFEVSTVEALTLHVLTEVSPAQRGDWLRKRCSQGTLRLSVRGESITSPEERLRVLQGEMDGFYQRHLPKLVELGILERA